MLMKRASAYLPKLIALLRASMKKLVVYCGLLLVLLGAQSLSAQQRRFRMGFSSWPYDLTQEAVDWVYQNIQNEGDLVLQHIEEGVPWNESLMGAAFPPEYQQSLMQRRARLTKGKKLLVAINSLNTSRSGLALYRTDEISQPLPEPWASYALDDSHVRRAYLAYAKRIIEALDPDYLIIGVEVNLLMRDKPELWKQYVRLQRSVYKGLKRAYPKLPVLVSLEAVSLIAQFQAADSAAQRKALQDILPYTDILGLSLHPYLSQYSTGPYPFDIFKLVREFTKKPIAITETSFPAQPFTVNVNGADFLFDGSEEKQQAYFAALLQAAQRDRYRFVAVFSVRDYDALWEKLGRTDLMLLWRDGGFFSETGEPRSVLSVWRSYLNRKFRGR
jgi:hypothetical protein